MGRGGGGVAPRRVAVRWRTLGIVAVALLLASPVSAWFIMQGRPDLPFDTDAGEQARPAWIRDLDGDRVDDRLAAQGTASVIIAFTHKLAPEERLLLEAIPGLDVIHYWSIVDGAWALADLANLRMAAGLPFVARIEADPVLEPTLDVSTRSLQAQDARAGTFANGQEFAFLERGVWRRSDTLEGVTGKGVMVALLDGGIDDQHPSLDDLDDRADTTDDPKVALKLNVWAYAFLNASVGQAQEVDPDYPYVTDDPSPTPIPTECDVPTAGATYCGTARPLVNTYYAAYGPRFGGPYCTALAVFVCTPVSLPPWPTNLVPPPGGVPQLLPGGTVQSLTGGRQLFAPPPFTALPHSTALAAAIAGTGDNAVADQGAELPLGDDPLGARWAYAGVAPGAQLVDVNLFIGVDAECAPAAPPGAVGSVLEEAVADPQCPAGPRGSSQGVQVGAANAALGPAAGATGSTLITGAEMVQAYNAEASNESNPAIGVAVIPLLDIQSCAQYGYQTLMEAAVDALAQTNVTVVTSVGQNRAGVCVPANVPRTIAVGAIDGHRTVTADDDTSWTAMSRPADEGQEDMAKPDLTAPGVDVWTARTPGNGFYNITGSSIAAAQVAGIAALALEAGNRSVQGLNLKTKLIQTANGSVANGLDPAGYRDGGGANDPGDGVRDGSNRTGWIPLWGFGEANARNVVCSLRSCPLPWENLATSIFGDPEHPFPTSAHVGEEARFRGRAVIDDPRAGAFWLDRGAQRHYTHLGTVGPGVRVNFAFTNSYGTSVDGLQPLASAVTAADGSFDLKVPIPSDKRPGATFCALWIEALAQTPQRDGLAASQVLPCALSVFSTTKIDVDLCGEGEECDPNHKVVSYLNDPSVDFLRGIVRLTDAAGQPLEQAAIRVQWSGAEPTHQDLLLLTGQNTGEALIKLPIRGVPGIHFLNVSFTPPASSFLDPATVLIPVTVSIGTTAAMQVVGREPGAVLVNDGTTLPIAVAGTLRTFLGQPIPNAPVELAVEGRIDRSLGTTTTDAQGRFTVGLDARPLQSGTYGLFVRYHGERPEAGPGFLLLPTTSARVPFTVVVQPQILVEPARGHRGEDLEINGTVENPFGRPVGNETLLATWIGGSTETQQVKTDRSGRFTFTRRIPADEPLGPLLLRIQYPGSPEFAPAEAALNLDVNGRSTLSVFPGEVRRGNEAELQGFLYDDSGRPLVGQKVQVLWSSTHVGNATTDALGHYRITYPVPADERAGPVTVRVAYAGRTFIEGSNAQGTIGVLAPTDLIVDAGNRSANQVLEFTTRLLDDQGRVVTDPQPIEVYIASPRGSDGDQLTLLSPLDLSNTLAPELRLSHAYRLATGFGVSEGARVQVSLDQGRTWSTVMPRQGYPDQAVSALDGPGFNGETHGWFPQRLDLAPYGNEGDVRLRWRVATSPLNNDLQLAIDNVNVRDGNRTLFTDDFERFGSKQGANYWSVPATGGFIVGREQVSGTSAGVLATNLAGQHPALARLSAQGPNVNLPANAPAYVAMRYRLDVGNAQDYATLSLRYSNTSVLLHPILEPQHGQLPETDGRWRWLFYELPATSRGRQASLQLAFQSDGLLAGSGLQVDELRMFTSAAAASVPVADDQAAQWTLNNFNTGRPADLDTYVTSQDARSYTPPPNPVLRRLDGPLVLGLAQMPFRIAFFGETHDRITVYPEGIVALGNTAGLDPSAFCRTLPAGQECHLDEVPGFAAPLVAPAWDPGLSSVNAFAATATVGSAPNRQFIIEWRGLQAPNAPPGSATARFAAVFHEDGDIEFRYGSLFFGGGQHDLGGNATVGIGQPGRPGRTVEFSSHDAVLTDNLRVYFGRVLSRPTAEMAACSACQVLAPHPSGTYPPSATSEAILESGVDLSQASEAYLVARQFVSLGRGDTLTVSARTFGSNSWRVLPVLMGGQAGAGGAFQPDTPAEWSTAVYDLSNLVGQRVKVRFQITADGAGQDVGILVRDLSTIVLPRTGQPALVDSFNSYLDTSQGSGAWWTSRRIGQSEAQPAWSLARHDGVQPSDLGTGFLALGDGRAALEASTQYLLTSPRFDLRNSKAPVLEWWQSFLPTDQLDGAVLEVSTDGGISWRPARPDGGVYDENVPTLSGAGWRGPQFGFRQDTFDLTAYTGRDVRLRLELGLGASPFSADWILDEVQLVDRLGDGQMLVAEGGAFAPTRWDRDVGNWSALPQATAIARHRDGIPVTNVLVVTGATAQHRLALPETTQRGPVQATILYRGASDTFGGAMSSAHLLLQAEGQLSALKVRNDLDGKAHLVRDRTFTLEGQLRTLGGQVLADRLLQIELSGVPIGSARTGPDGSFRTSPLVVLPTTELGRHTLRVVYGGDPADHVQGTSVDLPVAVKGIAQLRIDRQVARGDRLDVSVTLLDDHGTPLPSTAALVAVVGQPEEIALITDSEGRARFSAAVAEDRQSEVEFEIRALGTQDIIGTRLEQATVVPAAPEAPIWPYLLAGAVLLAAIAAAVIILMLRRRRIETLQQALARELERTRYALATGDPVRESIFGLYRAFLAALARAGRPAAPTQTAAELAATLGDVLGPAQRGDVVTLTTLFSQARYSDDVLGEDDRRSAVACLQRLEAAFAPAPTPEASP